MNYHISTYPQLSEDEVNEVNENITKQLNRETMIAIKIDNKKEFDLLMANFEGKGWKHSSNAKTKDFAYTEDIKYVTYGDYFEFHGLFGGSYKHELPFYDFAQIAGIEVEMEKVIELCHNRGFATVKEGVVNFDVSQDFLYKIEVEQIYAAYKEVSNGN